MRKQEIEWTHKVVQEMRNCNARVTAIVAHARQEPGIPDRYVCHTYWAGWLEFKGAETKVTVKQSIFIREHNKRHPETAFVVRYPNVIEDHDGHILEEWDGTGKGLLVALGRRRAQLAR